MAKFGVDADHCTVCDGIADATFNVGVQKVTQNGVSKFYQNVSIPVPVCTPCRAQEVSKVRSGAKASLIVWGVLVALGGAFGGWSGAGLGFALGFFITLGMSAFKKPSKLGQHPKVQEYVKDGYSITYP